MMRPSLTFEWIDPLYFSIFDHERFASRVKRSSSILVSSFVITAFVSFCEIASIILLMKNKGSGYISTFLYGGLLLFFIRLLFLLIRTGVASVILDVKKNENVFSDRIALANYTLSVKVLILPFAFIFSLLPSAAVFFLFVTWSILSLLSFFLLVKGGKTVHDIDTGTSFVVSICSSLSIWFFFIVIFIVSSLFTFSFFSV